MRRRRRLVDKPLQYHMIGSFAAVGALAALAQVALIVLSTQAFADSLDGGEHALVYLNWTDLFTTVLVTLAILVPVTLAYGIFVTHRIAGPAYRMRNYLMDVAANGVTGRVCKVRDGDEMQDMCGRINLAIEALARGPEEGKASPDPDLTVTTAPSSLIATEQPASKELGA